MNEQDKWLDITVKAAVPGAQINRLDDHLTGTLPAAVCQKHEAGKWSYEPNDKGEYIVRCHVLSLLGLAQEVIKHYSFEITGIKEMPAGKDLPLPKK